LQDVRDELNATKARRPLAEIRRMVPDAPAVRSLPDALTPGFRLIAEIKARSPSVGPMRAENIVEAPQAYEASPLVGALSVLTNALHFGMAIECLSAIRAAVTKPVLRKDFIIEEYQIREARAFGADAVLLMANVLDATRLQGFYELTRELGMEALFEVHTLEEIGQLPATARLVGINSRKFKATSGFVGKGTSSEKDFSLDYSAFDLAEELPPEALKIAESGLSPENIATMSQRFNAALVGTSLLRDERGVVACLEEFAQALEGKSENPDECS
jgi:indole-3-glycerol phosphate synthase